MKAAAKPAPVVDGLTLAPVSYTHLNQQINEASAKLSLVNTQWPTIKTAIPIAASKLNSINESDINGLIAFSAMNQTGVQNYFDSPVVVQKQDMYPINNYGCLLYTSRCV